MRADRLLSILLLLQVHRRLTARQLAERLEVSPRTIHRDMDALSAAGVPVYAEPGPGGGCALQEGYKTGLTGLTESEVRTLFVSGVPGPLKDLGLGDALGGVLLKLLATLPSAHRVDAERARERIYLDAARWHHRGDAVPHLRTLQGALWRDRKLRLTYGRRGEEPRERLVEPYGLVAKAGVWYLVAAVADGMRVYRVSRILTAEMVAESFERPSGFDLQSYWEGWCAEFERGLRSYPLKVRVAPRLASQLEYEGGDGVRASIRDAGPPDTEGWLTLTLTYESAEVARATVLSFGPLAEVLAPCELRESVRESAVRLAALYATQ